MNSNDNLMNSKIAKVLKPMELLPISKDPLVSVLIANYNYANYIGRAIQSTLEQTYSNLEIVICDDGSTDSSRDVIESFISKDTRIKLICQQNEGQSSAFNTAYAAAKGEIICFLDSDDLFYAEKIEKVVEAFSSNPKAGFCIHKVLPINAKGRKIGYPIPKILDNGWIAFESLQRGAKSNFPPTSGMSFRREVLGKIFPLPQHFRIAADGALREIAQFITEIEAIPQPLACFRLHGNNNYSGRTTLSALRKKAFIEYPNIFLAVRKFLTINYGDEVASYLRLEDAIWYWELLLRVYILSNGMQKELQGYTLGSILSHLPNTRRKHLYQLLLKLPHGIASRILEFGIGNSFLKRKLVPILFTDYGVIL